MKLGRQIRTTHKQGLSQRLRGNILGQVALHVIGHRRSQLSRVLAQMQTLHALGEFQHHVVLEVGDLLRRVQSFAALNVGIAEREGVLHLESTADGSPGAERRRDNKDVFHLAEMLGCQDPAPHCRSLFQPVMECGRIALADHAKNCLLLAVAVVGRRGRLLRAVLLQDLGRADRTERILLVGGDRQILQLQLLAVYHIVDGAEHQQQAFDRHVHDSLHTAAEFLGVLLVQSHAKGKFPQLLIGGGKLPGRADDESDLAGAEDAVIIEMLCQTVTDMLTNTPELLLAQQHGVTDQCDR